MLGGTFGLPHAQTHAVLLPHVLALNTAYAGDRVSAIAAALGAPRTGSTANAALAGLATAVGAPRSLNGIGLREADIPEAVDLIMPVVPPSNPAPVTPAILDALLRAAWRGGPPESPSDRTM
ncbi:Lactaldehyde reductase [Actinoplanes sp. SE50]|uniref:iron-containing alcohol dehydrogenase n=1 Tax=unclassified Actinoplanes TaxID=2626549 RepID=UPI00023EC6A1|nr:MULTISPECIES: iron-containing alcohol dehydrogenase [unclassified Actinoplanes]AEV86442.1 Lactaldehyde reductase [Actinoplanes sp. SE50/110]ATO84840.1 Lactaldehyde reductase [Actinoplanes sp. SE50]SLM02249.1 lactaldehyde reductase [Actinoplanes sp. SE50/110]